MNPVILTRHPSGKGISNLKKHKPIVFDGEVFESGEGSDSVELETELRSHQNFGVGNLQLNACRLGGLPSTCAIVSFFGRLEYRQMTRSANVFVPRAGLPPSLRFCATSWWTGRLTRLALGRISPNMPLPATGGCSTLAAESFQLRPVLQDYDGQVATRWAT